MERKRCIRAESHPQPGDRTHFTVPRAVIVKVASEIKVASRFTNSLPREQNGSEERSRLKCVTAWALDLFFKKKYKDCVHKGALARGKFGQSNPWKPASGGIPTFGSVCCIRHLSRC